MRKRKRAWGLFCVTTFVYALMTYGGMRSPDSEVVFRVAESLASKGSFAAEPLESWPSFGLPVGVDGKHYAWFGPLQSILVAPLIVLGQRMNQTEWYEDPALAIPISHYVDRGLNRFIAHLSVSRNEPHALRFLVSFSNVAVGALGVVLFWLLAERIADSEAAASFLSIVYAFGTLAWPYAGTFFSEPLATTLALASFCLLVKNDPGFGGERAPNVRTPWLAGLALGLAACAHLSAILFAPFFLAYSAYPFRSDRRRKALSAAMLFALGVGVFLLLLGVYDFVRFGDALETGRTVSATTERIRWISPLYGARVLLFSAGKGLLLYCPVVMLGLLSWPTFHRRWPAISWTLIAAALFRIVFIGSRSNWHSGFGLGPRYLVMSIPFLLLPASAQLAGWLRQRRFALSTLLVSLSFVCIAQQLYFCLGEIFSYTHQVRWRMERQGIEPFVNDWIYRDWHSTPLLHLFRSRPAPWVLQQFSWDAKTVFLVGLPILAVALALGDRWIARLARDENRGGGR